MIITDVPFRSDITYGVAIVGCGYEERSSYLVRSGLTAERRLAIDLGPGALGSYDKNRSHLGAGNWELVELADALDALRAASGLVSIDISSLPRRILARLIRTLVFETSGEVLADIYYAPADFAMSSTAAGRVEPLTATPLDDFFVGDVRHPSIPVALILGLGLEPHRGVGVVELLEPSRVFAMMGVSADNRFRERANSVNQEMLTSENTRVLYYDVASISHTFAALESLCFSLQPDYRVVIAPSGPKVYALAALLVGCRRNRERPSIWRVGSQSNADAVDVRESGEVIGARIVVNDELRTFMVTS